MRLLVFFTLVFFVFQSNSLVFGQRYSFLAYSLAEGLPQSQVSSIAEDNNGYLWVGTLGGLAKFNGATFVNFSADDGLLNNRITALKFIDNRLWIGHEGGISCYHAGEIQTWRFDSEFKNTTVTAITKFKDQWVFATNGGGVFVLNQQKKLRNIQLNNDDENRVRALEVFDGKLILASRGGIRTTSDLTSFYFLENTDEKFNASGIGITKDALFFTSFDDGMFRYSFREKQLKPFGAELSEMSIRNCKIFSASKLWSVSRQGIAVHDFSGKTEVITESNGLPVNGISVAFQDRNGTIWIGSEGKGLLRFPGEHFQYFKQSNGISSELITASLQIKSDEYWFGTFDKGLIRYNQKTKTFTQEDVPSNIVWAIQKAANGSIWVATELGLVQFFGSKKIIYDELNGAPGQKATCFYTDVDGKIWVGGSNGLSVIESNQLKKWVSVKSNKQDIGTIRSIVRYKSKLICAADGGVFSLENNQFVRFLGIKKTTFSLKVDGENNLWIGTEDGLYWSDSKQLKAVVLSDQPASNFVNFIQFNSKNAQIYVGTNNGLFALSNLKKQAKATVTRFGIEDGLVNLESNINSGTIDFQGNLWFGTAEGLTIFSPTKLSSVSQADGVPFLNVKGFRLNFQAFNYLDYSKSINSEGLPENLKLPFSKNNLVVDLDGVILKNAKELKYQYFLEGLDDAWSPTFSNPQLTLSNLPSGDFVLKVRALNSEGLFSKIYKIPITVTPVFYKTWWFYTLVVLLVFGAVFGFFTLRLNRERAKNYREKLEFKSRLLVLEQQSLNASMNRHFIFNSLNSIQYFINTQDRISANRYLTNFAKLIRKNLDSSTEENNRVALSEEVERLELYLSLESMRFRNRFDFEINVDEMDTEQVMVPAMLLQPFVENSIIHGILPDETKKGKITIEMKRVEDHLEISIEDNGIGIDFSLNKKKVTYGDHRSQGMEITSKRFDLLKKLSHQDFDMEGPVQVYDSNRLIKGTRVLLKIPLENLED